MARKLYRQGDVILEKVCNECEEDVKRVCGTESNRLEIVGETGHRHVLEAEVCRERVGQTYVIVHQRTALVHDQHPALDIEPGVYELRFVRDWLLEDSRPID